LVSDDDPLADPLVEKVHCGQREQNGHTHAVHHGDVHDVQVSGILEMNHVIIARVKVLVSRHSCLLSLVGISSEFIIQQSLDHGDQKSSGEANIRQDSVDDHGLHNLGSDISIPDRHIVIIPSSNILCNKKGLMLGHISIDQKQQDTRVEKLRVEDSIGDGG
jgi:hypothetical protein